MVGSSLSVCTPIEFLHTTKNACFHNRFIYKLDLSFLLEVKKRDIGPIRR
jgi:hypothetical protein